MCVAFVSLYPLNFFMISLMFSKLENSKKNKPSFSAEKNSFSKKFNWKKSLTKNKNSNEKKNDKINWLFWLFLFFESKLLNLAWNPTKASPLFRSKHQARLNKFKSPTPTKKTSAIITERFLNKQKFLLSNQQIYLFFLRSSFKSSLTKQK